MNAALARNGKAGIGLFGLDKLGDVDATVTRLTKALTQATG